MLDDEYVKANSFLIKSIQRGDQDLFLYILGSTEGGRIYYGKLNIETKALSQLCEKLYWIQSKMAVSEKKSEPVKNRDFELYKKDLQVALLELGKKFFPSFYALPQETPVDLSKENIGGLINVLERCGNVCVNEQLTRYLRHLHECKYRVNE